MLDAKKLQIASAKACPPGPLSPPPPGSGPHDDRVEVEPATGALDVVVTFRGTQCAVQVTAWYDANADGRVSRGDLTGTSSALVVEGKGIFGNNRTRSPDVALTRVP